MNLWVRSALRKQGLAEIFFESDEPPFDEFSPAQFFERFPAGIYEIEGITLDGEELEAEVRVSHAMPGRPGCIKVNGQNAAVNCDATLPVVAEPVTLDWNAVAKSHPKIGTPNVNVSVLQYEVVGGRRVEVRDHHKAPERQPDRRRELCGDRVTPQLVSRWPRG